LPAGKVGVKAVTQSVQGSLFTEDGRAALLLQDNQPQAETADSLYLRFAFVTREREERILPALILDDWGAEIKSLNLYEWVNEFGDQFPRAELFGFDLDGQERQYFLRELELYARLPCYAYAHRYTPLSEGLPVEAILLPREEAAAPRPTKRPIQMKRPLRTARVSWWQVPPAITTFDFSLLDSSHENYE
jgi:hypothetical protein